MDLCRAFQPGQLISQIRANKENIVWTAQLLSIYNAGSDSELLRVKFRKA
jgi:hypothetical protein